MSSTTTLMLSKVFPTLSVRVLKALTSALVGLINFVLNSELRISPTVPLTGAAVGVSLTLSKVSLITLLVAPTPSTVSVTLDLLGVVCKLPSGVILLLLGTSTVLPRTA